MRALIAWLILVTLPAHAEPQRLGTELNELLRGYDTTPRYMRPVRSCYGGKLQSLLGATKTELISLCGRPSHVTTMAGFYGTMEVLTFRYPSSAPLAHVPLLGWGGSDGTVMVTVTNGYVTGVMY